MRFDPAKATAFHIDPWEYDPTTATLSLHYRLEPFGAVCERVIFGGAENRTPSPATARAFDLVAQLVGISYYKAALPAKIVCAQTLSPRRAAFLTDTYRHGLGELAFTNDIVKRLDTIGFDAGPELDPVEPGDLKSGAVVPVGGGKDSLVTIDLLRREGIDFRTISVGQSARIASVVERISSEHILIQRHLDKTLFDWNAAGAINGHVPISAILASIMIAAGTLYDFTTVVMSNERSAEEPNTTVDGVAINHQYSKSLAFESQFGDIVRTEIDPDLQYFSLLRPYSELRITSHFSTLDAFDDVFSSCNANFSLQKKAHRRWCGNCPKCRFVYLALAPFIDPQRLHAIFETDMLNDKSQSEGYAELLGLSGHKPFECVGEIEESRAAWHLVKSLAAFTNARVINELTDVPEGSDDWIPSSDTHRIPKSFLGAAARLTRPCD